MAGKIHFLYDSTQFTLCGYDATLKDTWVTEKVDCKRCLKLMAGDDLSIPFAKERLAEVDAMLPLLHLVPVEVKAYPSVRAWQMGDYVVYQMHKYALKSGAIIRTWYEAYFDPTRSGTLAQRVELYRTQQEMRVALRKRIAESTAQHTAS